MRQVQNGDVIRTVRISQALYARIRRIAYEQDRTLAAVIRRALERYAQQQEEEAGT